jgi:hypothetical protein
MAAQIVIESYIIGPSGKPDSSSWVGNPGRQKFIAEPVIGDNYPIYELGNGPRGFGRAAIDAQEPVGIQRTATGWAVFIEGGSGAQVTEERALELMRIAGVERTGFVKSVEREALLRGWVELCGPLNYRPECLRVCTCELLERFVIRAASKGAGQYGSQRKEREGEVVQALLDSGLPLPIAPNRNRRFITADFICREVIPAYLDEVGKGELAEPLRGLQIVDEATALQAASIIEPLQEECRPRSLPVPDGGNLSHKIWEAARVAKYAAEGQDSACGDLATYIVRQDTSEQMDEMLRRVLAA